MGITCYHQISCHRLAFTSMHPLNDWSWRGVDRLRGWICFKTGLAYTVIRIHHTSHPMFYAIHPAKVLSGKIDPEKPSELSVQESSDPDPAANRIKLYCTAL